MDGANDGQADGANDAPEFDNVPSHARACVFDRMAISFLRVAYWVETADGGLMYWDLGHTLNRLCEGSAAAHLQVEKSKMIRSLKLFCTGSHLEKSNLHLRSLSWGWPICFLVEY